MDRENKLLTFARMGVLIVAIAHCFGLLMARWLDDGKMVKVWWINQIGMRKREGIFPLPWFRYYPICSEDGPWCGVQHFITSHIIKFSCQLCQILFLHPVITASHFWCSESCIRLNNVGVLVTKCLLLVKSGCMRNEWMLIHSFVLMIPVSLGVCKCAWSGA